MCYKPLFVLLIFLKAFSSFAEGADTLKLFYAIGKYDLSQEDMTRIAGLVDSLADTDTLKIYGYADYLGDESDNVSLSFDRARTVKSYVISVSAGKNFLIITAGKGEISGARKRTREGEPFNRRVELVRSMPLKKTTVSAKLPPAKGSHSIYTAEMPTNRQLKSFKAKINALANLDKGSSIALPEITFQPGRHLLNPEAMPYVDTLLTYLKTHVNLVFEIQGHICCVINEGDSQDYDTGQNGLSTNRAKAVYDYFAQNGISTRRMSYKGLGSTDPKVWPEMSEHDRYLNRRVEILVISK